jgi:hypothetical protein
MNISAKTLLALGAFALAAASGFATAAFAQNQPQGQQSQTPKGWSYEIQNGRRVNRTGNRVNGPDGSWREEVKQGNCVTVKERSASGEYKETRQCNPN